jgi:hypothetical protein
MDSPYWMVRILFRTIIKTKEIKIMKITIDSGSEFADFFKKSCRADNFSYSGLCALYEYLEECDPDMELDVIAICCDWSEYDSAREACEEMSSEWDKDDFEGLDEEELEKKALEHIQERSSVISGYDGDKCIVQSF